MNNYCQCLTTKTGPHYCRIYQGDGYAWLRCLACEKDIPPVIDVIVKMVAWAGEGHESESLIEFTKAGAHPMELGWKTAIPVSKPN